MWNIQPNPHFAPGHHVAVWRCVALQPMCNIRPIPHIAWCKIFSPICTLQTMLTVRLTNSCKNIQSNPHVASCENIQPIPHVAPRHHVDSEARQLMWKYSIQSTRCIMWNLQPIPHVASCKIFSPFRTLHHGKYSAQSAHWGTTLTVRPTNSKLIMGNIQPNLHVDSESPKYGSIGQVKWPCCLRIRE